nr:12470_t:CDS:2 [Entrophospora candida]
MFPKILLNTKIILGKAEITKPTLSIAIKENTYRELKSKIGLGKISSFVNQVVEKELQQLMQVERKEKEQLKEQLIKDYQTQAKNKKLQKELKSIEETQFEDLNDELCNSVAMMTTDDLENVKLFEVFIQNTPETGLDEPSKIVLNNPFTIFKELRLEKHLGVVSREVMEKVKIA